MVETGSVEFVVEQQHLKPPRGARKTARRYGRGNGSGRGTYSGRGMKGQKSRSGPGQRSGLEGWQLPWIKGMPKKRGFKPPFPRKYSLVNLSDLDRRFATGDSVTPHDLIRVGLIRNLLSPIKVLGDGATEKALTVSAHRFSSSAKEKLLAVGGAVTELDYQRPGRGVQGAV